MGKFDDEYVEHLSVEELLSEVISRVLETDDQTPTEEEINRIRRELSDISTEFQNVHKKIDEVRIGQWLEARLQALEMKDKISTEQKITERLNIGNAIEVRFQVLEDRVKKLEKS